MRLGRQTIRHDQPITIAETFSLAGSYEAKGNFKDYFDLVMKDDEWGCKTFEATEIKMQKTAIEGCLQKCNLTPDAVDCILGGDLINQIVPTAFSARDFDIPFMGLYNACSTFGEAMNLGAMLMQEQFERILCITSSHYATAERQYRFPMELGTQPTPASQWTVTGTGCALLTKESVAGKPRITHSTIGKVKDLGITDANNMGAAMAPAACDTIVTHLKESGRDPAYYDLIITGDMGRLGRDIVHYLCKEEGGYDLDNLNDCGSMIYDVKQKPGQGGSGAGCVSLSFCSYLYKRMIQGELKKILLVPTGALLSKDTPLQGESIPAIAHALAIETEV